MNPKGLRESNPTPSLDHVATPGVEYKQYSKPLRALISVTKECLNDESRLTQEKY